MSGYKYYDDIEDARLVKERLEKERLEMKGSNMSEQKKLSDILSDVDDSLDKIYEENSSNQLLEIAKLQNEETSNYKPSGVTVEQHINMMEKISDELYNRIFTDNVEDEKVKFDATSILDEMAKTYAERKTVYGENYLKVGTVMTALYPDGVQLKTVEDFTKWHLFELIIVKLTRFVNSDLKHVDSIHDTAVYAAMLEATIKNGENNG